MNKTPKKRRLWWDILRLAITLGAVAFVINQIQWRDRLRLPNDQYVFGWSQLDAAGQRVLVAEDGAAYPIPPEENDPNKASPFLPGFVTLLKGINGWLFAGALLAFPFVILLAARRWQWLLRTHDLDPGFVEALRLTWIGLLTNNVFPGATGGDLVKGWLIYRRTPGKRLAAVMTVLMDRVVGLVSLMLVGAAAIMTQADRPQLVGPMQFVLWVLLAMLLGGIVFFSNRLRKLFRVAEILKRMPSKLRPRIQQVDDSVFHYHKHKGALARCVGISLIVHLWTIGCVYLLGRALGLDVSLVNYYIFLPVIFTVGAVAPSIAGLGVLEGLFQQFFSLPGVGATPSSAVALCILYRIMSLLGSLPGALPTYREFSAHGVPPVIGDDSDSQAETPPEDAVNRASSTPRIEVACQGS